MSDQPQAVPQARASSVEIPVGAHYLVGVGSAARGLRPRRSSMFFGLSRGLLHRTLAASMPSSSNALAISIAFSRKTGGRFFVEVG
jgi:hypothetical protein